MPAFVISSRCLATESWFFRSCIGRAELLELQLGDQLLLVELFVGGERRGSPGVDCDSSVATPAS